MKTATTLIRLRDAEADLSLRWVHISEGMLSHVAVQVSL